MRHTQSTPESAAEEGFWPTLLLFGEDTPVCVNLLINKPVFVLGKAATCDGVLAFNPEISRRHCRIWRSGSAYAVRDLESTNHTYLNDFPLRPDVDYMLNPGDHLRLATTTFVVERIYNVPEEE